MKRKLLLLIVLSNVIIPVAAQMKWGGKVGANINSRSGYNETGLETGPIFTFQASIFGVRELGNDFVFQPSLGYYGKGMKFRDFLFTDNLGNDLGTGDMYIRFDYFELSLPFLYKLSTAKALIAGAGPYVAYAFNGKNKATNFKSSGGNSAPQLGAPDFDHNNRFDGGITLQLGVHFSKQVFIVMNYDHGVIDINKGGGLRSFNRSGGLSIGYIFN